MKIRLAMRPGSDEWGGTGIARHTEAFRNLLPADRITPVVGPLECGPEAVGGKTSNTTTEPGRRLAAARRGTTATAGLTPAAGSPSTESSPSTKWGSELLCDECALPDRAGHCYTCGGPDGASWPLRSLLRLMSAAWCGVTSVGTCGVTSGVRDSTWGGRASKRRRVHRTAGEGTGKGCAHGTGAHALVTLHVPSALECVEDAPVNSAALAGGLAGKGGAGGRHAHAADGQRAGNPSSKASGGS